MMNQLNTERTSWKLGDDDLPLGKTFSISDMMIVAASVLEKNGKYYQQIFLHEFTYDL